MIFRISASLDLWIRNLEIEAASEEEAKEKLSKMSVSDILDECEIKDHELKDVDCDCVGKTLHVHATDIDYSVDDEDMEDSEEYREALKAKGITDEESDEAYDVLMEVVEAKKNSLPKELDVEVEVEFEDINYPDDAIADAITNETGWLINGFNYKIISEE